MLLIRQIAGGTNIPRVGDNWGGGYSSQGGTTTGSFDGGGRLGGAADEFGETIDPSPFAKFGANTPITDLTLETPDLGIPVYDENMNVVGQMKTPSLFAPGSILTSVLSQVFGFDAPMVYSGDENYNPNNPNSNNKGSLGTGQFGQSYVMGKAPVGPDPGSKGPDFNYEAAAAKARAQRMLLDARMRRADAMAKKRNELSDAFGFFSEDYFDDYGSAFKEYQQSALQKGYDDSLRGIYEGFKAQGLLRQADVDEALAGLDAAKQTELGKIDEAALEYNDAKRKEIKDQAKKLGDSLANLAGGATTIAEIDKQTKNIEKFDFSKQLNKLKNTSGEKTDMEFFTDFAKAGPAPQASINVQAESTAGIPQFGEITPITTGIRSPFDSRSIRVV